MEVEFTSNAILREIERETASIRLIAAARRAIREREHEACGDPPCDHPDPRLIGVPGQAA